MSFESDLKRISKRLGKSLEETVRATAMELATSVIRDTPVDQGRARGNWMSSLDIPRYEVVDRLDRSGTGAVNSARQVLRGFEAGSVFWMTNSLPYINKLEYGGYSQGPGATSRTTANGYSSQAPAGMVRKNVARFKKIISKEAWKNKL